MNASLAAQDDYCRKGTLVLSSAIRTFVSCRLSIDSLLSREMLENRGEWMFYPDVKEYLRKMRGNIDFAVMKERLPLVHRYWQVTEAEVEKNCSRRI